MPISLVELGKLGSMGDTVDELLDTELTDADALRTHLEEMQRAKFQHPGLMALKLKLSRLEAERALALDVTDSSDSREKEEGDEEFGTPSPMGPSPMGSFAGAAASPTPARRGSIFGEATNVLGGVEGGPATRTSVVINRMPGSTAGRRGSIVLPPGSAGSLGRRGSVMMPPGSPGALLEASGDSVQVAGPAGRRASVAIQMHSLEALFEEDAQTGDLKKSEWNIVFFLALPLVISNLADEVGMIGLIALWGRLGTVSLAAGNFCTAWLELALVVIYGFQQTMYSLVPQAAGAENVKQVSSMLTMSVMWTCGILLVPVAVFYYFFSDIVSIPGSISPDGYGYGEANSSCADLPSELTEPSQEHNSSFAELSLEEEKDCDLSCVVTSYSRWCTSYLLPYVLVETARCWLGSLEIVAILTPNASFWGLIRVPLYWLLMFPLDLGIKGYAIGFAIANVGELLGMYIIVVLWKKPHLDWWQGINCKDATDRAINSRFVKMGGAASIQLAASFASEATLYGLIGTVSGAHVAAYGVIMTLTCMGRSLCYALFTATSVCVGTRLGSASPARAKQAALAGVTYNVILGVLQAAAILSSPSALALLLLPNEEDEATRQLIVGSALPTAVFCIMQGLQWGMWSVLEGQARVAVTSVFITLGWWGVGVPLCFLSVSRSQEEYDPCDKSASRPLQLIMWSLSAGLLTCNLCMASWLLVSDWQKLSDEAVAHASEAETEEDSTHDALQKIADATASQHTSQQQTTAAPLLVIPGFIPSLNSANNAMGVPDADSNKETALIILDEWMDRWNALDESVWTGSVAFSQNNLVKVKSGDLTTGLLETEDKAKTTASSDKFARLLTPLKEIGWHHSKWTKREVLAADTNKVVYSTTCLRYSADDILLGEFSSNYEVRCDDGSELWQVRWVGDWAQSNATSLCSESEDDPEEDSNDGWINGSFAQAALALERTRSASPVTGEEEQEEETPAPRAGLEP